MWEAELGKELRQALIVLVILIPNNGDSYIHGRSDRCSLGYASETVCGGFNYAPDGNVQMAETARATSSESPAVGYIL